MNLLIVEDDADLQEIFSFVALENGFIPTAAGSLDKVVSLICSNEFIAAMVDLTLVDAEGSKIAKLVKDHVPIVYLVSGHCEVQMIAQEMKVDGYLKKPCDLDQLAAAFKEIKATINK